MLHRFVVPVLAALISGAALPAQTVTEENLLSLKRNNAPEEFIIKAISMAKKIAIDTSFENTVRLMGKGISQGVVDALVQRKAKLEPAVTSSVVTANPVVTTVPTNPPPTAGACPNGDGAYFLSSSGWKKMEQAPLLEMSQNLTRATNPFGKKTMGFKLDGPEAPVKVGPKPEFCVVSNSDISVRSIKVVKLAKRGKNRELTTSSSGVLRRTKVMEYDSLDNVHIERRTDREIAVTVAAEIDTGEYALMLGGSPVFDFSVRTAE
jgi:hypothetical protein